jgi:integrase
MRPIGNRGQTCAPRSSSNGEKSRDVERPATIVRPKPPVTFDELFDWWMKEYGSRLRGQFEGFLRKRLVARLDKLPIEEVTSARIEELLQHQVDELSPKSLNEMRGTLHRIFKRATQRGFWHGPNPAATVEKRKVPRKLFDTLRADEVPRLLAALSPSWRPLFATAIWTAMRKGELLGLQKNDIDFVTRSIAVRRSYDHETTKGGHADLLPIAGQLRPFLEQAWTAPAPTWCSRPKTERCGPGTRNSSTSSDALFRGQGSSPASATSAAAMDAGTGSRRATDNRAAARSAT